MVTPQRSETELNTALNSGSVSGMPGDFEGSTPSSLKQQTLSLFAESSYQRPLDEVENVKEDNNLSPLPRTA